MVGYFSFRTPWGCLLLSTSEPFDENVHVRIDVLLDPVAFASFWGRPTGRFSICAAIGGSGVGWWCSGEGLKYPAIVVAALQYDISWSCGKNISNLKVPPKNSLNGQRAPCLEWEKLFSGLRGAFIEEVP